MSTFSISANNRLAQATGDGARRVRLVSYSPGDGVTRYRLVHGEPDYFGGSSIQTVLGRKAAEDMVNAFLAGWYAGREAKA